MNTKGRTVDLLIVLPCKHGFHVIGLIMRSRGKWTFPRNVPWDIQVSHGTFTMGRIVFLSMGLSGILSEILDFPWDMPSGTCHYQWDFARAKTIPWDIPWDIRWDGKAISSWDPRLELIMGCPTGHLMVYTHGTRCCHETVGWGCSLDKAFYLQYPMRNLRGDTLVSHGVSHGLALDTSLLREIHVIPIG